MNLQQRCIWKRKTSFQKCLTELFVIQLQLKGNVSLPQVPDPFVKNIQISLSSKRIFLKLFALKEVLTFGRNRHCLLFFFNDLRMPQSPLVQCSLAQAVLVQQRQGHSGVKVLRGL